MGSANVVPWHAACFLSGGDGRMTQKTPETKFWLILAALNIAALLYPVGLYLQADSNDTQLSAIIVVVGIAFVLAVTDTVSALLVYME